MSETVILESMEIWRQNVREIRGGTVEKANTLVEEKIQ
jgi:hypothetical protein